MHASIKRSLSALAVVILALCAAASSAAAQGATEPDSAKITPAMIDAGRAIFHGKGTCFACHGMQLEGTQVAPTLKAHAWKDAKNGDLKAIFGVITHGVPSTVMVAFPGGISKADAVNVASYIWSVGHGRAKP
ncbi:MAG: c-type cytochrome [Gemmatimonadetes bacterium]|nr:c-type cytochrome [Gemmatimonadota bacterium]